MEPYVYRNGDVSGAEPEQAPPLRPLPRGHLALRARRARVDPNWKNLSEATKRLLLDLDARERGPR